MVGDRRRPGSLFERWADDDRYGDAGLQPADEPLPAVTQAISLSINESEPEPWNRYMVVDPDDDKALAAWYAWFRHFMRERGLRAGPAPETGSDTVNVESFWVIRWRNGDRTFVAVGPDRDALMIPVYDELGSEPLGKLLPTQIYFPNCLRFMPYAEIVDDWRRVPSSRVHAGVRAGRRGRSAS